jgi:hypothetical protein
MTLTKTLKKLCSNHMVIFTVLAAFVLIYYVNNYSAQKSIIQSGYSNGSDLASDVPIQTSVMNAQNALNQPQSLQSLQSGSNGHVGPANPLGQNSSPGQIAGVRTDMHGLPPSCTRQSVVDPKQLLPRDGNNEFSKLNPMGAGDVANVSLLKAGYHVGINTVGQSLRNANLQLRSEPANPQLQTGPWNTSTIGPDFNRRPMEIGCGSN